MELQLLILFLVGQELLNSRLLHLYFFIYFCLGLPWFLLEQYSYYRL